MWEIICTILWALRFWSTGSFAEISEAEAVLRRACLSTSLVSYGSKLPGSIAPLNHAQSSPTAHIPALNRLSHCSCLIALLREYQEILVGKKG
jgi:hypothetical protein